MVDLSKYEDHDIAREPEDDVPQLFMGDETLDPVTLDFEEVGNHA
jgi:hypothetical protein